MGQHLELGSGGRYTDGELIHLTSSLKIEPTQMAVVVFPKADSTATASFVPDKARHAWRQGQWCPMREGSR